MNPPPHKTILFLCVSTPTVERRAENGASFNSNKNKRGKPLGLEKQDMFNVFEKGKWRGRTKNEFNLVTHFANNDEKR